MTNAETEIEASEKRMQEKVSHMTGDELSDLAVHVSE